ncbi:MAG: DegT/DnrJ/EryC1/StrS family aminotransferase [Bacteriovoracaceae bacterium]|nr:DegT/DnrJ/EryC1/StrS family aminotransferase [Bacteriovoracaceae bacterium]
MKVNFYDFPKLHHESLRKDILKSFDEIMEKGSFIEGTYNGQFEKEFGEYCQAKHCLLVANGTDAIEISLQANDIGAGSVVALPSLSFYATAEAIINVGATPVFVDINPSTGLICLDSLKSTIQNQKIDALLVVDLYGHPVNIEEIETICSENGIVLVEDAAQAAGSRFEKSEKMVGSGNHLTTFSFYVTKNLGAMGDAGAILTDSDELAEKVIRIRNHGRSPSGHTLIGRNSRCDHFQAAVLFHKFKELAEQNTKRKELAKHYLDTLADLPLKLPKKQLLNYSCWHLFPILAQSKTERDKLQSFLQSHEVGSALFYEKTLMEEGPLAEYQGADEKARDFASRVICIPIHPFLTSYEQEKVVTVLRDFYSN